MAEQASPSTSLATFATMRKRQQHRHAVKTDAAYRKKVVQQLSRHMKSGETRQALLKRSKDLVKKLRQNKKHKGKHHSPKKQLEKRGHVTVEKKARGKFALKW